MHSSQHGYFLFPVYLCRAWWKQVSAASALLGCSCEWANIYSLMCYQQNGYLVYRNLIIPVMDRAKKNSSIDFSFNSNNFSLTWVQKSWLDYYSEQTQQENHWRGISRMSFHAATFPDYSFPWAEWASASLTDLSWVSSHLAKPAWSSAPLMWVNSAHMAFPSLASAASEEKGAKLGPSV